MGIESSPPIRIGTTPFFIILDIVFLIVKRFFLKFFSSQGMSPQSTALFVPLGKSGPSISKLYLSIFAFSEDAELRIDEGPFLAYGPTVL